MKKVTPTPNELPDLFGSDSLYEFLVESDLVNTGLLYSDPLKEGWRLVCSLQGEGEAAPELFKIYEKDGQKAVIPSDFVNRSASDSAAATSADQHDPGSPKALQAGRSRGWSSLISSVHFFDKSSASPLNSRRLHALIIAKGISEMIAGDLERLLSSTHDPNKQGLIAKEAGAAYESGLRNFLASIGARKKKGTPRQSRTTLRLPWEWLSLIRAQQFVAKHGRLPVQAWLIKQLRQDGVVYQEDNGRGHSKWSELLKRAGLASLAK